MTDSGSLPDTFHAHVYFIEENRAIATELREQMLSWENLTVGRLKDEPIGPHPIPMFYAEFAAATLGEVLPWLLWHRAGLSVLIHPFTPEHERDHTERAVWLGPPVYLRLSVFAEVRSRETEV